MKITNVEAITFRTKSRTRLSRWGYPVMLDEEVDTTRTITRISTDEGVEGYCLGGDPVIMERVIKPLLVGENPLDREKLWNWMDQMWTSTPYLTEAQAGIVDCALWDLFGRMLGLPVHKVLGGCRDKVKAYASTHPNMGGPEVYAQHALECKKQGYKAYKVHANIYWNPYTKEPWPQLPGFPKEDVEICRAVR